MVAGETHAIGQPASEGRAVHFQILQRALNDLSVEHGNVGAAIRLLNSHPSVRLQQNAAAIAEQDHREHIPGSDLISYNDRPGGDARGLEIRPVNNYGTGTGNECYGVVRSGGEGENAGEAENCRRSNPAIMPATHATSIAFAGI